MTSEMDYGLWIYGLEITRSVQTVSYTHLDVYKRQGKQFALVNNEAQGLFSVAFLKEALPTLRKYCEYFGLRYSHEQGYTVKDLSLIHI